MTNSQKRSFGQEFNTWIQTLGIIIAAVWGAYAFIYKEIILPKSAPINITLSLQLHKIGEKSIKIRGKKSLIAVEMKVSATNPSSRTVYLLPNVWWVYGEKVKAIEDDTFLTYLLSNVWEVKAIEDNTFLTYPTFYEKADIALKLPNDNDNDNFLNFAERHSELATNPPIVAVGRLFNDEVLRPNETVMRTVIFHIPVKEYDLLEANSTIPTVANSGLLYMLEWGLGDSNHIPEKKLYKLETHCVWWTFCIRKTFTVTQTQIKQNDNLDFLEKVEYQEANATVGLSLWH